MHQTDSTNHRAQRVYAALDGNWPDRVPICEQAFASSVASEILGREVWTGSTDIHYAEACAWLDGEQAHDDWVEQLYLDMVELHETLDLDIFFLPWRMETKPTRRVADYEILYGDPDGEWDIYGLDPGSRTYGKRSSSRKKPTADELAVSVRKMVDNVPDPEPPPVAPMLMRVVEEYGDTFAVSGFSGMAIPMDAAWLELTVLDPALMADYVELCAIRQIAAIESQVEAGMRIINGGGDFAFNSGPIYSPSFFHEVMAPRWKRLFDRCRELGAYYIMRSDGDLWPVADDLFGWGNPHAYYEVDYDAGMHFDKLRGRFPELTLVGNVSSALLLNGTSEDVSNRVIECIEAAKPRVIAASANSILHGTPPENAIALFETAKNYALTK